MIEDVVIALLGAGGVTYLANAGHHLVKAVIKQAKVEEIRADAYSNVRGLLGYQDGLKDAGMDEREINTVFYAKLGELGASDGRPELVQQRNYHLRRAFNPFHREKSNLGLVA